jgi:adenosylhomocysteine nucleosidase
LSRPSFEKRTSIVEIDYGILTAVPLELAPYKAACQDQRIHKIGPVEYTVGTLHGQRVAMVAVGWGTTCTAAVMTHLICHAKPKGVFFSGTAGGIDPSLRQGDVVVGEHAFEVDMLDLIETCEGTPYAEGLIHSFKHEMQPRIYDADPLLLQQSKALIPSFHARARIGLLATGNNFPISAEHLPIIRAKNVTAYAMEGSAVYQTSWLFGTPNLVVRGISNLYSEEAESDIGDSQVELAGNNAAELVMEVIALQKKN